MEVKTGFADLPAYKKSRVQANAAFFDFVQTAAINSAAGYIANVTFTS